MINKNTQEEKNKKTKIITKTNSTYSVGDSLIRIKNSAMSDNKTVILNKTKLAVAVSQALKRAGILREVVIDKDEPNYFSVSIAYSDKEPLFTDIKLVSKPGLRVYMGVDELSKHRRPSVLIVSTPKGVMTTKEALKENCGGEVIAEIY